MFARGGNVLDGLVHLKNICSVTGCGEVEFVPNPQSKYITHDWVGAELTLLEAQADKLRRSIERRRASNKCDADAQIVDHYEKVLANLEHQIAELQDQRDVKETSVELTFAESTHGAQIGFL